MVEEKVNHGRFMTVFEDAQILTIGDTIIESRSLLPLDVLVRIVFKTLK